MRRFGPFSRRLHAWRSRSSLPPFRPVYRIGHDESTETRSSRLAEAEAEARAGRQPGVSYAPSYLHYPKIKALQNSSFFFFFKEKFRVTLRVAGAVERHRVLVIFGRLAVVVGLGR